MSHRSFAFFFAFILLLSCGRTPSTTPLTITLSSASRGASDFTCFYLNVVGPRIEGANEYSASLDSVLSGNHCTYAGYASQAVASNTTVTLTSQAPIGSRRVVQVIGVKMTTGNSCPAVDFKTLLAQAYQGSVTGLVGIYEAGRKLIDDLTASTSFSLTLDSNYLTKNLALCSARPEFHFAASSYNYLVASGSPTPLPSATVTPGSSFPNSGSETTLGSLTPSPTPTPFLYTSSNSSFNNYPTLYPITTSAQFVNSSTANLGTASAIHVYYAVRPSTFSAGDNWDLLTFRTANSGIKVSLEYSSTAPFQTTLRNYQGPDTDTVSFGQSSSPSAATSGGVVLYHLAIVSGSWIMENLLHGTAGTSTLSYSTTHDFTNFAAQNLKIGLQSAHLGEMLIYLRNLTTAQQTVISQYLKNKYN